MSEEIKDFIREQNKELSKELVQQMTEIIDTRIVEAGENMAISVNKTFQRIEDELYAFRREHASSMKNFGEKLDHLSNFTSDLYDDHERRLRRLEAA